jgi:hypothetical protein
MRWLLFLEYDFLIVYKPRRAHYVANILSQHLNATKNLGIIDQTIDASLFVFQPKWLREILVNNKIYI